MTDPVAWTPVVEYKDIRYEHSGTGIAKVTIDRPYVRNAFRPQTVRELIDAFARIRDDPSVGCVLLTGAGDMAFCSGGDQKYKSHGGGYLDPDGVARLNVLDLQRQMCIRDRCRNASIISRTVWGRNALRTCWRSMVTRAMPVPECS